MALDVALAPWGIPNENSLRNTPTVVGAPLVGAHCFVQAGIHRAGVRPTWGKHVTPQPPLSGELYQIVPNSY